MFCVLGYSFQVECWRLFVILVCFLLVNDRMQLYLRADAYAADLVFVHELIGQAHMDEALFDVDLVQVLRSQLRPLSEMRAWQFLEIVLLVLCQCVRGVYCLQCRLNICIWLNLICEKKYNSTAGCNRNRTSCGAYQNLTLALASADTA